MVKRFSNTSVQFSVSLRIDRLPSLAALLAFVAITFWRSGELVERQKEKPAALTQEQTQEAKELQRQRDISRANAEALQQRLAAVQAGEHALAATYDVHAPTIERVAQVVERQIKADDPTLPRAAREKSERTIMTPITKDNDGKELPPEKQKVDVYKVNLRKDHRVKAGATMMDGRAYATVGYEQGRLEALLHFDGTKPHGASVKGNDHLLSGQRLPGTLRAPYSGESSAFGV